MACVGDSITFGACVDSREQNCYPAVLGRLLGDKYEVQNFGVIGATLLRKGDLPYWTLKEFGAVGEYLPQIMIIKLGTNDSKPKNWAHQDEFVANYAALLDHFAGLPSKPKIYACLPVPAYSDGWTITEKTIKDEIIPLIIKVAKEKNVAVIDLHTALSDHKEMFPDGIHPNVAGAALIAQTISTRLQTQRQ